MKTGHRNGNGAGAAKSRLALSYGSLRSVRFRTLAAITAVTATALLPAVGVVVQLAHPSTWYRGTDDVSVWDRLFEPLRTELHGVTKVGYFEVKGRARSATDARTYMTRYALAPIDVVGSVDADLVIAMGVDPARLPSHFRVRRDFGNGLLLLERERTGRP
jgi:hypothetical protein